MKLNADPESFGMMSPEGYENVRLMTLANRLKFNYTFVDTLCGQNRRW